VSARPGASKVFSTYYRYFPATTPAAPPRTVVNNIVEANDVKLSEHSPCQVNEFHASLGWEWCSGKDGYGFSHWSARIFFLAFGAFVPCDAPAAASGAHNLSQFGPATEPASPPHSHNRRSVHGSVDSWQTISAEQGVVLQPGTVLNAQFIGYMNFVHKLLVCEQS
jgi:hypothetical protein